MDFKFTYENLPFLKQVGGDSGNDYAFIGEHLGNNTDSDPERLGFAIVRKEIIEGQERIGVYGIDMDGKFNDGVEDALDYVLSIKPELIRDYLRLDTVTDYVLLEEVGNNYHNDAHKQMPNGLIAGGQTIVILPPPEGGGGGDGGGDGGGETPSGPIVINGYKGVYTASSLGGLAGWNNSFDPGIQPTIAPIVTNSLGDTISQAFSTYIPQIDLYKEAFNRVSNTDYQYTGPLKVQLVPPQTGGYGGREKDQFSSGEINFADYDSSILAQGYVGSLSIYKNYDNSLESKGHTSNFRLFFIRPVVDKKSGRVWSFIVHVQISLGSVSV